MNFRSLDNPGYRLPRPRGRPPFKPAICDPMQPSGRGRFMQPSIQQQPQYQSSVGYSRTSPFPPEYAAMQYTQQVSPAGWSQSMPITLSDQSYQYAGQQVYNSEPAHMVAMQNASFMSSQQVQSDFDPLANISTCSKCHAVNSLAHLQLKTLTEEKRKLVEQLSAMERRLVGYEGGGISVSPAPQTSSLSVDAQPFQMGGASQEHKTHSAGNASSRSHSNGNWSYVDSTPVVSASDIGSDRYVEPASDAAWDTPEYPGGKSEPSVVLPEEPPSVSANCGEVVTPSGHFSVEPVQQEADSTETVPAYQGEARSRPRDESHKTRPRPNTNRTRGGRNDGHDVGRNFNSTRRESGASNSSRQHRSTSPQERREARAEKSVPRSRDSSQSSPKSGPDKKETDPAETPDSRDRSLSERRVDYGDRGSRGARGGSRRYNEQGAGRGGRAEESNWRSASREQDVGPRENHPRPGNRVGGGARRQAGGSRAVVEKEGDLFGAPDDYSLAHCVAEDFRMGSGIAVNFRTKFKQVEELMDQKKRAGQVALLEEGGRFVFYLVTKRWSSGKPTWTDFADAVTELSRLCVDRGVKNLAMPRIGCGLDRLEWRNVRQLLEEVFADTGVTVTAYNFQQNDEPESPTAPAKAKSTLYFVNQRKDLVDIDAYTGLIFLCSEDNAGTNRTLESLDRKHKIVAELRATKRAVGEVVSLKRGNEYLYGLVVRKAERDPFSYVNLGKCLRKLRSANNKEKYGYFGMEAFRDDRDTETMEKVATLLWNIFGRVPYKLEFHVCWPRELEGDHLWEDAGAK